jgi:putative ABC transport system permease protein
MSFRRLIRFALLNLVASRQRSLLAVLGIGIGIASVIAMVSLGAIARAEATRQFQLMGTDLLSLTATRQPRRMEGFSLGDALSIPTRIPVVQQVAPRVETGAEVRAGRYRENRILFGVTGDEAAVRHLKLVEGRFLIALDQGSRVCVLATGMVAKLASQGARTQVGDWLSLNRQMFQVVGVLAPKDVGSYGDTRVNEAIYVPIAWALRTLSPPDVPAAGLRIVPGVSSSVAVARVNEALTRWKGDTVAFQVTSPEELLRQMEDQLRLFTVLLGIIASISLVVGGVGVMNIMLIAVIERRSEIGVRRALGARRKDIQAQFLVESVVLTMAGGVAGIVIGIAAAWIVATRLQWRPFVPITPVVLGVTVATVLGVFFGWYPARRAAALLPIEAMRA